MKKEGVKKIAEAEAEGKGKGSKTVRALFRGYREKEDKYESGWFSVDGDKAGGGGPDCGWRVKLMNGNINLIIIAIIIIITIISET